MTVCGPQPELILILPFAGIVNLPDEHSPEPETEIVMSRSHSFLISVTPFV